MAAKNLNDSIKYFLLLILAEHLGHENRIKRAVLKEELCLRLGANVSDRKMRDMLEELRNEERGCWICGSLKSGYFAAKDEAELRAHLAKDKMRIANIARRVRNQETHAGLQSPDQIRMEDLLASA
ncbi:MAG: hypothetical protein KF828_09405 [Anaerolineales bacterium]|nr:hypothetical protein [Anaerolineales bacterium]